MASPRIISEDLLRETVDREVLEPLFRDLEEQGRDSSVPEVVFENRRRRARLRLADALASRGSATLPRDLEREVERLVRIWGKRGFDDGFSVVETFELDRAQERQVVLALDGKGAGGRKRAEEETFRLRVRRECGRAALPGLPTSYPVLHDLESLWVPLTLERLPFDSVVSGRRSEVESAIVLDGAHQSVEDALKRSSRILVIGASGSGKSTLVAWIAARLAEGRGAEIGFPKSSLPLVIPARSWPGVELTPASLAEFLEIGEATLKEALQHGRVLLLLDGLDEAQPEDCRRLLRSLRSWLLEDPELRLVATSRPAGQSRDLVCELPGLETYRLVPFDAADLRSFAGRWYRAAERAVQGEGAEAERAAERAAADFQHSIERSRLLHRLAVSPLMASIFCLVHRSFGALPQRREAFYSKCLEAQLTQWERSRDREGSSLSARDVDLLRRLSMRVARRLHEKHGCDLSRSELEEELRRLQPDLDSSRSASVTAVLLGVGGLLKETGPKRFSFLHLSVQEYLAAADFVEASDLKKLVSKASDRWWEEATVLAAGIAGKGATALIEGLLAKSARAATLLAVRCADGATGIPYALQERVRERVAELLPPKSLEEAQELGALGPAVASPLLELLSEQQAATADRSDAAFSADGLVWTVYAVGLIDYEPSIPILLRWATAVAPTNFHLRAPTDGGAEMHRVSVGELVTWILFWKAGSSPGALRVLKKTLGSQTSSEFRRILCEQASSRQSLDEELGKKRHAVIRELFSEDPCGDPSL